MQWAARIFATILLTVFQAGEHQDRCADIQPDEREELEHRAHMTRPHRVGSTSPLGPTPARRTQGPVISVLAHAMKGHAVCSPTREADTPVTGRLLVRLDAVGIAAEELRRQVRARLSADRLPSVDGISTSRRGTGRPCVVCRRAIESSQVEREVQGAGVFLYAHEECYKVWREESVARRTMSEHEM